MLNICTECACLPSKSNVKHIMIFFDDVYPSHSSAIFSFPISNRWINYQMTFNIHFVRKLVGIEHSVKAFPISSYFPNKKLN